MSRFVIAAALVLSFAASVHAAAPTLSAAAALTRASSSVVTCPTRDCDIVRPGVRL
jgi:hypothetical protein